MMSKKEQEVFEEILQIVARGNTAEVKKRKDDLIVLEVKRTIKKIIV